MSLSFTLHPRLAADTHPLGDFALCRVLLMNDARFPWLILVPRRTGLREFADLPAEDHTRVMAEIVSANRVLRDVFSPDRINVAALGNIVDQLHMHIVVRTATDAAWPGPVWGHGSTVPYGDSLLRRRLSELLPPLKQAGLSINPGQASARDASSE